MVFIFLARILSPLSITAWFEIVNKSKIRTCLVNPAVFVLLVFYHGLFSVPGKTFLSISIPCHPPFPLVYLFSSALSVLKSTKLYLCIPLRFYFPFYDLSRSKYCIPPFAWKYSSTYSVWICLWSVILFFSLSLY